MVMDMISTDLDELGTEVSDNTEFLFQEFKPTDWFVKQMYEVLKNLIRCTGDQMSFLAFPNGISHYLHGTIIIVQKFEGKRFSTQKLKFSGLLQEEFEQEVRKNLQMNNLEQLNSFCTKPIKINHTSVAIIGVSSFNSVQKSNKDSVLTLGAGLVASALENEHVLSKLSSLQFESNRLSRISRLITAASNFEELLAQMFSEIKLIINAESGGVLLYESENEALVLQKPAFGRKGEKFKSYCLSINTEIKQGMGIAIKVFNTGVPYICNNPKEDPFTNKQVNKMYGVRNFLSVPLIAKGKRIGVLHMINKNNGFTTNDAKVLGQLADHLAVVVDNATLFQQLENKNQLLRHSMEIHNSLIPLVFKGESLTKISERFSEIICRDVIVLDKGFKVRGAKVSHNSAITWSAEGSRFPLDLQESPAFRQMVVSHDLQAKYLPAIPKFGLPRGVLASPIVLGSEVLGHLWVIGDTRPFDTMDYVAVHHLVTILTLKLVQDRIAQSVEERMKRDLVKDLLNGNYHSSDDFLERANNLGFDLREPHQLMVIDIEDINKPNKSEPSSESRRSVIQFIVDMAQLEGYSFLWGILNEQLLMLLPNKGFDPESLTNYLQTKVKHSLPERSVSFGIGRITTGLDDVRVSYHEANMALNVGKKFQKTKNGLYRYHALGVYQLLFTINNETEMFRFAEEVLGSLLRYSSEKQSGLLETLKVYVESGFNKALACEKLYIHINTLKYRLERIQEITLLDLSNSEHLLNIQLALKILEFSGNKLTNMSHGV